MLRIIRHAKKRGCFLELNAHSERLDLLDSQCRMAKEEGVLVSINSDAHSSFDFANLKYGVGQARRGWLEKDDVLNTRPLAALTKLLEVCAALKRDYGGSLDALHDAVADPRDLESRLKALGKGIGDTTVDIFLRELRGIWAKAEPPLSPLAISGATALGYLRAGTPDPDRALARLRRLWAADEQLAAGFADFESALVREGLRLRRLRAA
jgi:hypothetical protein